MTIDKTTSKLTKEINAWIYGSHLSDKKTLNDTLNNTRVDIGSDKDWSISNYGKQRLTTSNGKEFQPKLPNYIITDTEQRILRTLSSYPKKEWNQIFNQVYGHRATTCGLGCCEHNFEISQE